MALPAVFTVLVVLASPTVGTLAAHERGAVDAVDVTGRVVSAEDGDPVAGVTLVLAGTEGAEGFRRTTTTGDDGFFRLESVPPGRYTLRARRIGFATRERPRPVGGDVRRVASLARHATVVGVVAVLAGCEAGARSGPELGAALTLARGGAGVPTVAVDRDDGTAYVAWVGTREGRSDVWLARLPADGRGGEAVEGPVRVNDRPGDASPHAQAPAVVAVGPHGAVYVAWQRAYRVEGRPFPASDLRFARSLDGGRSFEPALTVHPEEPFPTSHTFHDLAVDARGRVLVAWLDASARDSAMAVRKEGRPDAVGGGAPASGPAGVRAAEETAGPFPLARTPGPRSRRDAGGVEHVARFTGKASAPGVYYGSRGRGAPDFGPPVALAIEEEAVPSQPAVAVAPDGTLWLAWEARAEEGRGLRLLVTEAGMRPEPEQATHLPGTRPALAASLYGAVLAWLEGDTLRARRITSEPTSG